MCGCGRPNHGRRTCATVFLIFAVRFRSRVSSPNIATAVARQDDQALHVGRLVAVSPCLRRFVHIGLKISRKIGSGRYSADPPMEHAFLPDDGGFECIFCGRTASEHQKASGGSYESTKPAERDLEMEDEDDWDAIQEELRRLTRRCRQARAAARSSQPTHPRASPAWLSRLRKRRPERRPSCSSQK